MTSPTSGPPGPPGTPAPVSWQRRQGRAAAELEVELWEAQGDVTRAWHALLRHVRLGVESSDHLLRRAAPLAQLDALGDLAPAWAYCRWVLGQAVVSRAPALRDPARLATSLSATVSFPEAHAVLPREPHRDWVRRQLLLFDLRGARLFLDHVASRRLRHLARGVERWADAAMGGYRCAGVADGFVTWSDLATGVDHVVADTGSAHFTPLGGTVVGRLVRAAGAVVFESIPLDVPERTAVAVAGDPGDWLAAVEDACRFAQDADEPFDLEHDFGVVDDVPRIWLHVVLRAFDTRAPAATAGLVRAALDDQMHEHLPWWGEDEQASLWPTVAAALLRPEVLRPLLAGEVSLPARDLRRLAGLLTQPAAALCDRLLARDRVE